MDYCLYLNHSCNGEARDDCLGGAYAGLLIQRGKHSTIMEFKGYSTNLKSKLRAELYAVKIGVDKVLAMNILHPNDTLTVYSSLEPVYKCYASGWWRKWRQNGWLNARGTPVANRDLWEPLIDIYTHKQIRLKRVKGHVSQEWSDMSGEFAEQERLHNEDTK